MGEALGMIETRGMVAMSCMIVAESAIFTIFVVAYVYNIGRSLYGPTPSQVLDVPLFNTVCLLSSSLTIWLAERAIEHEVIPWCTEHGTAVVAYTPLGGSAAHYDSNRSGARVLQQIARLMRDQELALYDTATPKLGVELGRASDNKM